MAKEIIWSESSIKDRYQIYTFWEAHNKSETYSIKIEKLFHQAVTLLSNFPEIGISTDFKNIKVKVVSHFKIFYLPNPSSIVILRIWDTRQNPEKFKM